MERASHSPLHLDADLVEGLSLDTVLLCSDSAVQEMTDTPEWGSGQGWAFPGNPDVCHGGLFLRSVCVSGRPVVRYATFATVETYAGRLTGARFSGRVEGMEANEV